MFGGLPSASPRHRPLTLEQNACSRPQETRSDPAGCGTRQLPNRTWKRQIGEYGLSHNYSEVAEKRCFWPHSNPGVILLVLEPVRVAGVTVRPRLDLMVKPDLNNTHNKDTLQMTKWSRFELFKKWQCGKGTFSLQSATPGHFWARPRAGFRFSHTHSPPASLHLKVFRMNKYSYKYSYKYRYKHRYKCRYKYRYMYR